MHDLLKIIGHASVDIESNISDLIFVIFDSFYPEFYQIMQSNSQDGDPSENLSKIQKKNKMHYNVQMIDLEVVMNKERMLKQNQVLFKNVKEVTPRMLQISQFCMDNKRSINKIIKVQNNNFVYNIEDII